jgi:CheY-like chemotaxis protein
VRLLWVENHAQFARMAGRQFLAAHTVTVISSLAAAKEALASTVFDVVLLDYDLDDGKGASLVEFMRALPYTPAVVAASSHEDGNKSLLAAGADAVCPKARFAEIEAVLFAAVAARTDSELKNSIG